MPELKLSLLNRDISASGFDCGVASINRQIQNSYYPTILQHVHCYELTYGTRIVGYAALSLLSVDLSRASSPLSDYIPEFCERCPSLHIKYIAIDQRYQGKGLGSTALKMIIKHTQALTKRMPLRLITLEAIQDKYAWYYKQGFRAYNENDLHTPSYTILMYFDCISNENQQAVERYTQDLINSV